MKTKSFVLPFVPKTVRCATIMCAIVMSSFSGLSVQSAPLIGGVSYNDDLPRAELKELKPLSAKLEAKLDISGVRPVQAVKQDCICFNGDRVQLKQINGSWKLVDNRDTWILDFGTDELEGQQALRVIQAYKLNNICFAGRPFPTGELGHRMMYFLSDGKAPEGPVLKDEDTLIFDTASVKAEQLKGNWKVTAGDMWMLDYGNDQAAAENAAEIIKSHEFRRQCYIGRPGPSMMYFLK